LVTNTVTVKTYD